MSSRTGLWLRREVAPHEERTPLVPADAARLVEAGFAVMVEEAGQRAFPVEEYAAAGCRVVPGDTWPDAPPEVFVLGLKEPSSAARALTHRHIFFGHAFKGQVDGPDLLRRLTWGGGTLLDLEELVDDDGRRVVAFGFWAGYVGAALAVLHHRNELLAPLRSGSREDLDARLRATPAAERALVVGALGRSGRGAVEALAVAGVPTTEWDLAETRALDREALLGHDILVNTVFANEPGTPFLTAADTTAPGRVLRTVSDVTCDVTSDLNRLPINDKTTTWDSPARTVHAGSPVLDVLAIDNLPSLLPRESSTAFSAGLLPHLTGLTAGGPVWDRARARFDDAIARLGAEGDLHG
ncbi:saccharopine dehydrogenase [Actinokineospora enzanensis]|uniref:saccharopine dehydrogenase n=1 Tax=Actinokineospora enzanensis TaxID=155975 RepID=UPI00039AE4D6|nr:saccharopine dehydrogenase [Actinokineospora enzanensis]